MADGTVYESEAGERVDYLGAWTEVRKSYENLPEGGMTVNAAIRIIGDDGLPKPAKARRGQGAMFGPGPGSGAWSTHEVIGGLGTSASINVALCAVLLAPEHKGELNDYWRDRIAHAAFLMGNEVIGILGGKQDEYASAFGGVNCFYFHPDGKVTVERLHPPQNFISYLEKHLVLFDTDESRLSSRIHEEVWGNLDHSLPIMVEMLKIARVGKEAILEGSIEDFASCLRETCEWQFKLNETIASRRIVEGFDALYSKQTIDAAKVCGAGGGGAFMALAKKGEANSVKAILKGLGYGRVLNWQFDFEGLKVWEMNHPRMTG